MDAEPDKVHARAVVEDPGSLPRWADRCRDQFPHRHTASFSSRPGSGSQTVELLYQTRETYV